MGLSDCGEDDLINFPKFKDPGFITRENYRFDGRIEFIWDPKKVLRRGGAKDSLIKLIKRKNDYSEDSIQRIRGLFKMREDEVVKGIVFNDYNFEVDGYKHYTRGFHIQDKSGAIFVRGKEGVKVERGDEIELLIKEIYEVSCKSCRDKKGQKQIKDYELQRVISKGNRIYCEDLRGKEEDMNWFRGGGAFCVYLEGVIDKKSSNQLELDGSRWAIKMKKGLDMSGYGVGDGVELIGIGDHYNYSRFKNGYAIYVYSEEDLSLDGGLIVRPERVEGIVLNDYDYDYDGGKKVRNEGFFIQDSGAGVFIRLEEGGGGMELERGDRVRIKNLEYEKSRDGSIRVSRVSFKDIEVMSKGNKIYCRGVGEGMEEGMGEGIGLGGVYRGPYFGSIRGVMGNKGRKKWGIGGWDVFFLGMGIKNQSKDILVGDEVMIYGIFDFNFGLKGFKNKIWVYDENIFNMNFDKSMHN